MAKHKKDNQTVDIELLILQDKIKELLENYRNGSDLVGGVALYWHIQIIKDLEGLIK